MAAQTTNAFTGRGLRALRWGVFGILTFLRPLAAVAFLLAARLGIVVTLVMLFPLLKGNLAAVWFGLATLGCMGGMLVYDFLLHLLAPPVHP